MVTMCHLDLRASKGHLGLRVTIGNNRVTLYISSW